jgi:IS5 family transposase
MTHQTSFAHAEFAAKKKITRREKFPPAWRKSSRGASSWPSWSRTNPKGERGRRPLGLERMLRVYFLQQWHGLADEALEDTLYDSQALQRFARIDFNDQGVPDTTTLLHFRHLLETHDLCKGLFTAISAGSSSAPALAATASPPNGRNAPTKRR